MVDQGCRDYTITRLAQWLSLQLQSRNLLPIRSVIEARHMFAQ
jgi:hypothetical protein